jgi:uncharacterized protein (DUF885 family)
VTTRPISDRSRVRALRCCGWLVVVACIAAAPATAQQTEAEKSAVDAASSTVTELAALADQVLALARENAPTLPLPPGTDPRYSDRMPVVSEEYFQSQAQRAGALLDRVRALDTAQLTVEQQLDVYVLTDRLRTRLADAQFRTYLVPIGDAGGFHTRFADQASRGMLRSVADYDRYIARLQSFGEHVAQQIAMLRIGLAEGNTLPGPSMVEDYAATIRPYVDDVPTSVFYQPLTRMPDSLPEADRSRIVRDGERAVRESVLPAYRQFLDFMVSEYLPGVRSTAGLSAVPGGREYYEHLVRHYTTLDITAEEVHAIGLRDVERLRAEMEAVMRGTGFSGTFGEFLHFLRTDPQFYVDDPEDYIRQAAYIAKRMDGQLPRLFRVLPSTPYGIRPFPDTPAALRGTGANYGLGTPGERAGYYNLNLSAIESRPLYVLEALTFHEAAPGHHIQIMLHRENEAISSLRRNSSITAFVEGWALYAERLGLEVGFFTDPYSDFGRLTYEIWRSCRLVVDTGIHAFGWTRQQAIDYMAENTALSVHEITTEVDRYIRARGQALAYKMGELKITELRRRAEQALGDRFDVRDFHHAVLRNGSIPLSFLEREIDTWIATTLAQRT